MEYKDITANVVAALKADSERKQMLIRTHVLGWLSGVFSEFAGLDGTPIYNSFVSGDLVYLKYCLRTS